MKFGRAPTTHVTFGIRWTSILTGLSPHCKRELLVRWFGYEPEPGLLPGRFLGLVETILAKGGILGIGDWGVGGIAISIGKLVVYTAAAGIDPTRVIPVMLDAGTNRESLLNDPLYIGNRHPRVRGERYDRFIEAYVNTATKLFPHALLHWEDFGLDNARRILEKYRSRICTFNDDMQGTGAITLAAILSCDVADNLDEGMRERELLLWQRSSPRSPSPAYRYESSASLSSALGQPVSAMRIRFAAP